MSLYYIFKVPFRWNYRFVGKCKLFLISSVGTTRKKYSGASEASVEVSELRIVEWKTVREISHDGNENPATSNGVALAWGIVMDSVTDNEKKQNLLAPKNFIKFAENYALLYWVFL